MGWLIFFIIIIGVCVFLYFRNPAFRIMVDKILKSTGGGIVSQKQLDEADRILEAEKKRTKKLEEQAVKAVLLRDKRKEIAAERTKQANAQKQIRGEK